ncbi:MAG: hypothetical protein Q9160_006184 [Pyrenula sp. 1 TL-2023]
MSSFNFGQNNSTSGSGGANLFGGNSNPFGTPSKPLFGAQSTTPSTNDDIAKDGATAGSQTPGFNLPKSSEGFSFGGKAPTASSAQNAFAQSPGSTTPTTPGQKPLFGAANVAPVSGSLFGSTTPATSGPSFFGQQSTTPAGPPPTTSAFGNNFFGTQKSADTTQTNSSNLFSKPATTNTTPPMFGQKKEGETTSAFGTGLFGSNQQTKLSAGDTSSTPAQPSFGTTGTTSSLFGSTTPTSTPPQPQGSSTAGLGAPQASSNVFSMTPAIPKPGPGLFGGSQSALNSQPQSTTPGTATSKPPLFSLDKGPGQQSKPLFGAANTTSGTASNTAPALNSQTSSSKPFSGFSLSGLGKEISSDKATAPSNSFDGFKTGGQDKSTTDKPSNTFSSFSTPAQAKPTATDQQASTASTTPAGLPTFSLKPPSATTQATTEATSTSTVNAPSTSASSLFGAKPTATSTAPPGITISSSDTGATASGALGASTTGPAPTSQSRLKNRTMDEILTRWASDLTKYQKEFQSQAEKVAEWDQVLVDNMAKITKLYVNAATAEKQTNSVEMQLRAVENQQSELESWLDKYESEVDDMIAKQNVQQGEALQGPDQERERTYKLAEKLSDRLDEMGNSLTGMIEDINSTSTSLCKTSKSDEPISQIVRILNAHLTQLQTIDQGTIALQAKIGSAQKSSQGLGHSLNGLNGTGAGNGAAEEFYRSYMGRRN